MEHLFKKIANYKNKKQNLIFLIFFLIGIISLTWFKRGFFVWGDDTAVPLNLSNFLREYFYIWAWKIPFSLPDVSKFPFLFPIGFILLIFDFFHLPFSPFIFQKVIVYFLFSFSGISVFFLFKTLSPKSSSWAGLLAGLFYMFNFYSFILWHSFSWIVFHYAFFPLILALFIKGINQEKKPSFFVGLSVLWTFLLTPAYITPPFMIISWFVIILYLIFYSLTVFNWQKIKKAFSFTFWLGLSWTFLNLFWMVPQFLFYQSEFIRRAVSEDPWGLLAFNSSKLTNIFRLLGPQFFADSYKGTPFYPWFEAYNTPLFILIGFSITILAFSAFLFRPKNKNLLFFGSLVLIFIFLVIGTNSPFPQITSFLFSRFRLAEIFRSVWQRFMGIVVLGSAVLFAFAVDKIIFSVIKIFSCNFWKCLLVSVFIILIGIYSFPFLTNQVFPEREGVLVSEKVKFPSSYYEIAKWLDSQSNSFNILPIPFPKLGLMSLSWKNGKEGYWGVYPLILLSGKRFLISDFSNGIGSQLINYLLSDRSKNTQTLNFLNIKYIIFHKDANWKYIEGNNWFVSRNKENTERILNSFSNLRKEKSFGSIEIYRNLLWKSYYLYIPQNIVYSDGGIENLIDILSSDNYSLRSVIYFNNQVENSNKDLPVISENSKIPKITFVKVNPTKYKIKVENAKEPYILVFSESFHEGWKAYINKVQSSKFKVQNDYIESVASYFDGEIKEGKHKNNFLDRNTFETLGKKSVPEERHLLVNGYANSWYITPEDASGDENYELIIEFWPQRMFYLGLFISILTLIGCLGYLVYDLYMKKKRLKVK